MRKLTFDIEIPLYKNLEHRAKENGRSVSAELRYILKQVLR